MTTPDDDLLALARKATPGPWWWLDRLQNGERYLEGRGNSILVCSGMPGRVNADWIVAANPSAIIAMIERHRAEVERLTRDLEFEREQTRIVAKMFDDMKALKLAAEAALAAAQKRIAELEAELAIAREDLKRVQDDNGQFGVGA